MENERVEQLLDRLEAFHVTDVVRLPPEEFQERLRDAADAQRELLTGFTDQIMRQTRARQG